MRPAGDGKTAKPAPLPRSLSNALQEGYATAANDTGHKGANAAFVPGNSEKLKDFADRAVDELGAVEQIALNLSKST